MPQRGLVWSLTKAFGSFSGLPHALEIRTCLVFLWCVTLVVWDLNCSTNFCTQWMLDICHVYMSTVRTYQSTLFQFLPPQVSNMLLPHLVSSSEKFLKNVQTFTLHSGNKHSNTINAFYKLWVSRTREKASASVQERQRLLLVMCSCILMNGTSLHKLENIAAAIAGDSQLTAWKECNTPPQ